MVVPQISKVSPLRRPVLLSRMQAIPTIWWFAFGPSREMEMVLHEAANGHGTTEKSESASATQVPRTYVQAENGNRATKFSRLPETDPVDMQFTDITYTATMGNIFTKRGELLQIKIPARILSYVEMKKVFMSPKYASLFINIILIILQIFMNFRAYFFIYNFFWLWIIKFLVLGWTLLFLNHKICKF